MFVKGRSRTLTNVCERITVGSMKVKVATDGWVTLPGALGASGLHLRVRLADDGRLVITDMFLHGDELTAEMVRGISISRLEAQINAGVMSRRWAQGAQHNRDDKDVTLRKLRARVRSISAQRLVSKIEREGLARPTGQDPEEFYRLVARAYSDYAAETKAPAKALAAEAKVPTTTAHRWVREARRRGFLPPARKGKAG